MMRRVGGMSWGEGGGLRNECRESGDFSLQAVLGARLGVQL